MAYFCSARTLCNCIAGIRGMEAREAIAADESFVSLPRAAALVVTPKIKCPFPDFVDAEFWSAKPW